MIPVDEHVIVHRDAAAVSFSHVPVFFVEQVRDRNPEAFGHLVVGRKLRFAPEGRNEGLYRVVSHRRGQGADEIHFSQNFRVPRGVETQLLGNLPRHGVGESFVLVFFLSAGKGHVARKGIARMLRSPYEPYEEVAVPFAEHEQHRGLHDVAPGRGAASRGVEDLSYFAGHVRPSAALAVTFPYPSTSQSNPGGTKAVAVVSKRTQGPPNRKPGPSSSLS